MRLLVPALSCLLLALPLHPDAAGFYLRGEEGWFWYERLPEPAAEPAPTPTPESADSG